MDENNKQQPLWRGWIKNLIFLSIGLVLLSFIAPLLLTQLKSCIEFNADTGAIGDTIGGIINPFIALAGVIVTGLAFYMQLKANEIQINNFQVELKSQKETFQKQLEIQKEENRFNQFEAQFYEMLRLHKENVNEIEIDLYSYNEQSNLNLRDGNKNIESVINVKQVKGRDVFIYLENELEIAFKIYNEHLILNTIFVSSFEQFNFAIPYKTFFNGFNTINESNYKVRLLSEKENFENLTLKSNKSDKEYLGIYLKAKYPLFEGHENKLGHYYRHLYHLVKFVAKENDFLTYPEKRKYLRILRAQLSNYEQAMLFYNYLAFAPEWEDENKFLSDYRMIHNLYEDTLIDNSFFKNEYKKIKDLQSIAKCYKDEDYIFESQKWDKE
jgi:hypothetical protein